MMLLLTSVAVAKEYKVINEGSLDVAYEIDVNIGTFCRHGFQWVYVWNGKRSGIAQDAVLVDFRDPTKGTMPILCTE